MKKAITLLKLIRYPNLIFIILTQYFTQYFLIVPILYRAGVSPSLSDFYFSLLVLATVLVAAAGYIINDYFDVKIDELNKPDKIYIDRTIRRRTAMALHSIINIIAVIIGFFLAWHVKNLKLGFIFPIAATLLWFYSTGYKKQLLTGNIVVSILTALVVLIAGLYEQNLFHPLTGMAAVASYAIFVRLFFYAAFAFLLSMIREIVKDMEDRIGDEAYSCRTLPIVIGLTRTKLIVYLISACVILLTAYTELIPVRAGDFITIIYLFITIQAPLIYSMFLLYKADEQRELHTVSTLIKIVMLMGIFTMLYFYYLMLR